MINKLIMIAREYVAEGRHGGYRLSIPDFVIYAKEVWREIG